MGSPFDLLSLIFDDEPKIICTVRDLRSILASMEKKHRQSPDKYRSIEQHATLQGTTTFKRTLLFLQNQPVGLALDRLVEIHQRGWQSKVLFLRFEDLTTQPAQTLQKVYQYLGIPDFRHNFEAVAQTTQEDDKVFGFPGLHDIRSKVEPVQNDYMSVLGIDAIRFVQANYAWYFKLFGYRLEQV